jgi:hypothetical protein
MCQLAKAQAPWQIAGTTRARVRARASVRVLVRASKYGGNTLGGGGACQWAEGPGVRRRRRRCRRRGPRPFNEPARTVA